MKTKSKPTNGASAGASTETLTLSNEPPAAARRPAREFKTTFHRAFNLSDIAHDPDNARKDFDRGDSAEFDASIADKGVQQPLWIRKLTEPTAEQRKKGHTHGLIAGERRTRAAKKAGRLTAPALEYLDITDEEAAELADLENAQREGLNDAERALNYAKMVVRHGWQYYDEKDPARSLAHRFNLAGGKSGAYEWKRIANLPKLALEALAAGHITRSVAGKIASIAEKKSQQDALQRAIRDRWTDKQASEIINREYMAELKGVPFKLEDAKLYAEAGACSACPYLSANQPEFTTGRGDICFRPRCLQAKLRKAFELRADAHREAGGEVWSDKTAEKNGLGGRHERLHSDYVLLDEEIYHLSHKLQGAYNGKKIRTLLAPLIKSGEVKVILAWFAHECKVFEIVERASAMEKATEAGLAKMERTSGGSDTYAKQAAETRKRRERGQKLIAFQAEAIVATAESEEGTIGTAATSWLKLAVERLARDAGRDKTRWIAKRRIAADPDLKLTASVDYHKYVRDAIAAETNSRKLLGWLSELLAWPECLGYTNPEKLDSERAKPLLEQLGLKSDKLLEKAKAALDKEKAANAKPAKKEKPEKAAPAAGKSARKLSVTARAKIAVEMRKRWAKQQKERAK